MLGFREFASGKGSRGLCLATSAPSEISIRVRTDHPDRNNLATRADQQLGLLIASVVGSNGEAKRLGRPVEHDVLVEVTEHVPVGVFRRLSQVA